MRIEVEMIHPFARVPTRSTPHSACYDLYSPQNVTLWPFITAKVGLGFKIDLVHSEAGIYEMEIRPRSSLGITKGILVHHGTIDSDYQGEIIVAMIRVWPWPYFIKRGDRIAQAKLLKHEQQPSLIKGMMARTTDRSEGGFGSTGR